MLVHFIGGDMHWRCVGDKCMPRSAETGAYNVTDTSTVPSAVQTHCAEDTARCSWCSNAHDVDADAHMHVQWYVEVD